jgi:hypothetical protein
MRFSATIVAPPAVSVSATANQLATLFSAPSHVLAAPSLLLKTFLDLLGGKPLTDTSVQETTGLFFNMKKILTSVIK